MFLEKMMKRIMSALVVFVLLFQMQIYGVNAGTKEEVKNYIEEAVTYQLNTVSNPTYGPTQGEWLVMGIARSGLMADDFLKIYKSNIRKKLDDCKGDLSGTKYTEFARLVIGLTAVGEDPRTFGGYDTLKYLAEYDSLENQGINGVIFGLIALDCGNYDVPKPDKNYNGKVASRNNLIKEILDAQLSDGGWAYYGKVSDTDITAMAIQALVPYKSRDNVKEAIDKGLSRLSELQKSDGSFGTMGRKTCESTAQVLTALSELRISINDSRFVKDENTVLDGLLQYYKDGCFSHELGGKANQLATEQAIYSLVAYYRALNGNSRLYQMNDIHKDIQLETLNPNSTTFSRPTVSGKNGNKNPGKSTKKNNKKKKDIKENIDNHIRETDKKTGNKEVGTSNTTIANNEKTTKNKEKNKKKKAEDGSETQFITEVSDIEVVTSTYMIEESETAKASTNKEDNSAVIIIVCILVAAAGAVFIYEKKKHN